jgi:hypothetical protein
VDSDRPDEAVGLLQADSTLVEIIRDDDKERNAEEYPQFKVRLGMERAFFQGYIFVLHDHMVTKEWVLIKIKDDPKFE